MSASAAKAKARACRAITVPRRDWREEVIVLSGGELQVYENTARNPRPDQPRLWKDRNYGRLKQYHNYYSP